MQLLAGRLLPALGNERVQLLAAGEPVLLRPEEDVVDRQLARCRVLPRGVVLGG